MGSGEKHLLELLWLPYPVNVTARGVSKGSIITNKERGIMLTDRTTGGMVQWLERWCSGESVHIVVGRPGVHSLSRVIPKDFKKSYSQLPCLALSIKKG